jgi:AbrB family looped-hinge helix DNA binding protein
MQFPQQATEEIWVKILPKGLITIPKKIRERLGIAAGDVAKTRISGNEIIIEPRKTSAYRLFTDKEIKEWVAKDKLPAKLAKKAEALWADIP